MADPDTEVDPAESKHGTIAANIQEAAKEVAREANKNLIMVRLSRLGVGGRQAGGDCQVRIARSWWCK